MDKEGMEGRKLRYRMESVVWQPPVLTFENERHGITVNSSKYAEVFKWKINFDTLQAEVIGVRKRLVKPLSPGLKIDTIVDDLLKVIKKGGSDPRIKADGRFKLDITQVIPGEGIPKR